VAGEVDPIGVDLGVEQAAAGGDLRPDEAVSAELGRRSGCAVPASRMWLARPVPEKPVIDTSIAHPARVYDYMIGGKDNYAPDRALAEAMTAQMPGMPAMLRANRDFLGRAVRHLVTERGVRQFLDIGSGIPSGGTVHQVAQEIEPTARVVYVDNDPIVLAHSRALLTSSPQGRTAFVDADATDPEGILADPAVFATLDRSEPIALMLVSVLMYFDDATAHRIVRTLLDALPPGSHLTISHPASDFDPEMSARTREAGERGGIDYHVRDRAGVARFFDGLDLVEPGIVRLLDWQPALRHPDPLRRLKISVNPASIHRGRAGLDGRSGRAVHDSNAVAYSDAVITGYLRLLQLYLPAPATGRCFEPASTAPAVRCPTTPRTTAAGSATPQRPSATSTSTSSATCTPPS